MNPREQTSPLTSQVTFTVLALVGISLAMVLAFGLYATLRVDRESLDKQRTFVTNGIAEQLEDVVRQQQSVTVWDDAVIAARDGDQTWMTENLGGWMYTYYGHDRVYVLDAAGSPVHAMRDGKTLPSGIYDADRDIVTPAVSRLREQISRQADEAETSSNPVAVDLVSIDGRPAILSVQPIVPSSNRLTQLPGTENLHVSIEFFDQGVIDRIAEDYLLADAHLIQGLMAPVSSATVPLIDSHGLILGYVGWTPDKPGTTLVSKAAPALLAAAFLGAAVLYFLLRSLRRSSRQLQRSQSEAQFLACHDTLTGLPNRALFEDRLRQALLGASRDRRRVALLYIDLDRFKNVNDTFGHPAGDELVRQTAARLQAAVRPVDTVARLGGDEFAIILPDAKDIRAAEDLCERLLHQIAQPFDLTGNQVFVGASIGVALSPDWGADPADLLRKADIALYEAKKSGRGCYQVFAGDMDDILARKRVVESELRSALTNGTQIKLLYQPVYAPNGRTILGAEALMRWDHPVHGALSPSHFVTIAEERGMIGILGDWVLDVAVRFAATTSLPWVAVNVSPLQLRDEGFPAHVLAILARAGLEPARLQLEITEGVLLENSDATRTVLAGLRQAGIHVALDDFGTGYSSLNYLRRHAIDKLKIDKSFVRLLGTSDSASAIVKALVDLASAMQVTVTAEGVETAEQRDLLVAMGCHELQGFLLSVPLGEIQMRALAAAETLDPSRKTALPG